MWPPKAQTQLARRSWLGLVAGTITLAFAEPVWALGRVPYGGTLRLKIPWPLSRLDPHAGDDPASAIFASSICDPLFALDSAGRPYPALAQALPENVTGGVRVELRPDLVTALGKALTARDVAWSLERARMKGAAGALVSLGKPVLDPKKPLSILIPNANSDDVARALASPLTAIVPRSFSPLTPDGTGAFIAEPRQGSLTLRRNPLAARGPAFLDSVEASTALDLADALRSFEAGNVDVGWLGVGLHRPRAGAVSFEGPLLGWAILRTGRDAREWGAPGIAQQLLNAIPPERLQHLGLRGLPASALGRATWGGGPAELLVADNVPHMKQIARTLEALLASPGNELRTVEKSEAELTELRRTRRFALMLDFVRPLGPGGTDIQRSLLAAADPTLAKRPPKLSSYSARDIARTLPLGIVGEFRASGAYMPAFQNLPSFVFGAVWLRQEAARQ